MDKHFIRNILFTLLIIVILNLLVAIHIDNHYYRSFLDGFWKTYDGENDIMIYFDTKEENAHIIISRNNKTLSDRKYSS